MARRRKRIEEDDGAALAVAIARATEELKAEDVRVLDVRGLTDVMDFIVLATGASERQLRALSERVKEVVEDSGRQLVGSEGTEGSGWVLVDTGDVVAHVFSRARREYYDLDGLWADARAVHSAGAGKETR